MKKRTGRGKEENGPKSTLMKKKSLNRLGGGGLSILAFANAKSKNNSFNPALIKKRREFYKNAKHVSKYKKSAKQNQQNDKSSSSTIGLVEDEKETEYENQMKGRYGKERKKGTSSLRELYEKKRQEDEKARMEREASISAKKEEREKAKTKRNSMREKMFKKTQKGQPVMKYRIERILETIGGGASLKR